jgi:hypothetical protein
MNRFPTPPNARHPAASFHGGSMNLNRWWGTVVATLGALAMVAAARAEDRDLAFVHSLENRGFGDVAIDYLDALAKRPDLPTGVRDLLDLEMSKSVRLQAQNASDPAERIRLLTKSQNLLDQFAKLKPNHPEAVQAQLSSAEMILDQAKQGWIESRDLKDPKERASKLLAARKTFLQAQPLFKVVSDKLAERLSKIVVPLRRPGAVPSKKDRDLLAERARIDNDLIRARGETSLIDYYIAQTYTDPEDAAKRKSYLTNAAKALDAIYQAHRGDDPTLQSGHAALVSHVWYGKTVEELGDPKLANDVYDEVLENMPEPKESLKEGLTGAEDVLSQAKHFSLLLMEKDPARQKEYLPEAKSFLNDYKKNFHAEWGYQAISFELAKHLLADSEKEAKPAEKLQLTKDAVALLNEMASVRSEFQGPAIVLRQQYIKTVGNLNPQNVDEALAFAGLDMEAKRWDDAVVHYRKAIELMGPRKDPGQLSKIMEAIANCQLRPIYEDFAKNQSQPFDAKKYTEWMNGATQVARDNKKTETAAKAAHLAVYCASVLYGQALATAKQASAHHGADKAQDAEAAKTAEADKEAAAKRLQDLADFTITTFPGSGEADEARLSMARVKLLEGKIPEALEMFEAIDPKSEKYPDALQAAGKIRYARYAGDMKKPEAQRDDKQMTEDLTKSLKHFADSVKIQTDAMKKNEPIPQSLIETKLLLAQIHIQAHEYKEAVDLLQPLVDSINAAHPSQLDDVMLQIFGATVKAYLGLDDFQKAGAAGVVLIDLGPDELRVNGTLIDFVRHLDVERKHIQDTLNTLPDDAPPKKAEALRSRLASTKGMMAKMLAKLADRTQLSAKSMIYIGSLFSAVDDFDSAEKQYKALQAKAASDEEFKKEAGKSLTFVRTQLIDLLRKKDKYAEAAEQVHELSREFPTNLDAMVEEAQILQAWAEKDPSKYDAAIAKWTDIRRRLQHGKKKESEYYDAIYNTAACLMAEARKKMPTDKPGAMNKAKEGEKVLNSEMYVNKTLNGPATVQRFKLLLAQLQALQGKVATPPPGGAAFQ